MSEEFSYQDAYEQTMRAMGTYISDAEEKRQVIDQLRADLERVKGELVHCLRRGRKTGPLRTLSLEQEREIVQRHKDGESSRTLARCFGVSPATIKNTYQRVAREDQG